jgi:undecaprenyl phosphate-alpha-L-ara4N flippase subunit ArnE
MKTPISSMLLVLFASFVGSFGAVFLKWGAGRISRNLKTLILNWRLAAGVALYLFSTVFYLMALKRGELSILFPMVSLGYAWTLLWARIFFGEPFTSRKFGGLALIFAGLIVLNFGRS